MVHDMEASHTTHKKVQPLQKSVSYVPSSEDTIRLVLQQGPKFGILKQDSRALRMVLQRTVLNNYV